MRLSVNQMSQFLGLDRATVKRRLDSIGMEPEVGPKGAHLYPSKTAIPILLFSLDDCCEANVIRGQIHKAIDSIGALKIPAATKNAVIKLLENALLESENIVDQLENKRWVRDATIKD